MLKCIHWKLVHAMVIYLLIYNVKFRSWFQTQTWTPTWVSTYTASTGAAASPPPSARGRRLINPGPAPPACRQGWMCCRGPGFLQDRKLEIPGSQTWSRFSLIRVRLEMPSAPSLCSLKPTWYKLCFLKHVCCASKAPSALCVRQKRCACFQQTVVLQQRDGG